jgi:hypothetical protein
MIDWLVFLDESGVNIDLSRRYGRSIGKKRVADHVPLNTPQTITMLSSICKSRGRFEVSRLCKIPLNMPSLSLPPWIAGTGFLLHIIAHNFGDCYNYDSFWNDYQEAS